MDYARLETIAILRLDYGANPNDCGGRDRYPIEVVVRYCPIAILERLLVAGASVNFPSGDNHSALEAAVLREIDAKPVVSRLLDAGAVLPQDAIGRKRLLGGVLGLFVSNPSQMPFFDKIEVPDGRFLFNTSLDYVFENGPGVVLMLLLFKFPQEEAHDLRYGLVLQMAALAGQLDPIRLLLSHGVGINATGYYDGTALKAAARLGHNKIVHQLLVAGANDNIGQGRWHTALEAAVASNNDTIVELLLKYGADSYIEANRRYKDRDVLQLAVKSNNDRTVQRLLAAGAAAALSREKFDSTAVLLNLSIKRRNILMVGALLRTNVPVNEPPINDNFYLSRDWSRLPIYVAAEYGHADIVHLLLERGANPDGSLNCSRDCDTPFELALKNGHLDATLALVVAGARVL
ncbi:multiple ankyrin repeats single kh domain protein [Grosmannia clavigera kw1407]|uniref:Multiple ankyrin repeats single kh domain protein n=1 Tax=Grosmannia clavigera (strain kw1407 / UAMH 11150) TaxID=655863 RepID=F0XKY5_GROCL|nr:multiple ankyrin repeats single kh domain protein [Grosmannia clavigera kw1407]EFX01726.1 multiple ankyrin repeats single kh domain protein [Grosmannia clavigera kw1407]